MRFKGFFFFFVRSCRRITELFKALTGVSSKNRKKSLTGVKGSWCFKKFGFWLYSYIYIYVCIYLSNSQSNLPLCSQKKRSNLPLSNETRVNLINPILTLIRIGFISSTLHLIFSHITCSLCATLQFTKHNHVHLLSHFGHYTLSNLPLLSS